MRRVIKPMLSVEKLFELVEFDTEPLDESSLVEEAIRILIEES